MLMTTQALARATVGEAMHPGVLTCPPETPLKTVAQMMAVHRIHCVVVFAGSADDDPDGNVWGVVSDLDLVRAAAAQDIETLTAGGTARTPVVTVGAHDSLDEAARSMARHSITHLVVVEPERERPLGILSTLDVARTLVAQRALAPAGTIAAV